MNTTLETCVGLFILQLDGYLQVEEVAAAPDEHDSAQRTQMELAVLGVTDEQAALNIAGLQVYHVACCKLPIALE